MKSWILIGLPVLATACSSPERQIVHEYRIVDDTVRAPLDSAAPRTAASSVFTRCLKAARLQARAHDETFGGYSALQDSARDANNVSICRTMPEIYLPELR